MFFSKGYEESVTREYSHLCLQDKENARAEKFYLSFCVDLMNRALFQEGMYASHVKF